ncbi:MAG: rhodanese-like domain-containing protein [Weeksellaceae bacterium]
MKIYKNLIDVRAPWEYEEGHVEKSINIPLDQIQDRISEINEMAQPILLCCQSGNRSIVATNYLQDQGIDCENGGGWEEVASNVENQKVQIENN